MAPDDAEAAVASDDAQGAALADLGAEAAMHAEDADIVEPQVALGSHR